MGMTNQVVNHAPTPRAKHDTNKKQVQWTSNIFLKSMLVHNLFQDGVVNVEIIYSQVVRKGETMPKLEWTRGHEWSTNVSSKGDHHCLAWARNSRKKWHVFYKNLKARVEWIKAEPFLNVAKAMRTNDMKPTLLKMMWKKRWWWASSLLEDCQKRTSLQDVQRRVTRKVKWG